MGPTVHLLQGVIHVNETNLQTYKLFIRPQDLSALKENIWSDDPVTGSLTINNKKLDIDVVYRGSHIRKFKKKSYHVQFYKPKTYRGATEIHLNAEYKDPSLIRNKLSFDFFSSIGVLTPKAKPVVLVLNGRQEGVYMELEAVDENYFKNRGLTIHSIFYAVDGDANFSLINDDRKPKNSLDLGYEVKYGTEEEQLFLNEFIFKTNTLTKAEFEKEIIKYVDVDKYLKWLAGVVCTQNYDGFVHNYALCRTENTGLFEVLPWDYDATWGRDVHGKEMDYNYVRIEGFNTLSARILDISNFRSNYCSLLNDILENQFTIEFMEPKIADLHGKIRPHLLTDPYKRDYIKNFDEEPQFIMQFIKDRNAFLQAELKKF